MESNTQYFFRLLKENFFSFRGVDNSVNISFKNDKGLSVMTFNIRRDTPNDGDNNWQYRREHVVEMISYYQPDVICFQEVMPTMAKYLIHKLSNYYDNAGVENFTNREMRKCNLVFGEGLFTMWRKDKFNFVGKKVVKIFDGRKINLRRFMDVTLNHNGKELHVINTHFCHMSVDARNASFKKIYEHVKDFKEFYICGDFNTDKTYKNTDITIFTNNFSYNYKKVDSDTTINFFGKRKSLDIIDYVFSNNVIVDENIIYGYGDCKYMSDHNPVIVKYDDVC
jgi:endonuclease/exonuclease/phosphatase family metal-dependent hydrolase